MDAPPVVLTIAGFDPSSGAGITADIKTIAAHGCYGVSCITALTVQSTVGVRAVLPTPAATVRQTLQELAADLPIAAIHIGMLGSGVVAEAVADFLSKGISRGMQVAGNMQAGSELGRRHPDRSAPDSGARSAETCSSERSATMQPAIVLDPILRSSSGAELLDPAGVEVLRSRLLPLATVITPNLDEAAALTGCPVTTLEDMYQAVERLHALGARSVVVKGGHLEGDETLELLSQTDESEPSQDSMGQVRARTVRTLTEYRGPKLKSRATHGTGCAFASALACDLALGQALSDAVRAAKQYVAECIAHAYPLGHGHGPMNHVFRMGELDNR